MPKLFKKFGLNLSLILMVILVIVVGVVLVVVMSETNSFFDDIMTQQATTANSAFAQNLQDLQSEALQRAEMIAASSTVVQAVRSGNEDSLRRELAVLSAGLDLVTVCDAQGTVLARTHSDKTGDSVISQNAISVAINTGTGISTIEPGTVIGLSTRGSAAIKDSAGNIIGALTCGHDLSQPKYVDKLKEENGCEVTFFAGDVRMNTTILDEKGQRVVGTTASDQVVATVINQKQDYHSRLTLFGHMYECYYSPVIVNGQAVGMLFTGVPIDDFLRQNSQLITLIVVAVVALLISVVIVTLIIRWITKRTHWYESMLDSIPFPLSVTDNNMKWTFINRPVEQMLNVKRADVLGKHCSSWGAAICNTPNCGVTCLRNNKNITFFDQGGMDFQVNISYLKDKKNRTVGHIELVQDITKMLSAQKEEARLVTQIRDVCSAFVHSSQQIAQGAQALSQGSTEQAAAVQELSETISAVAEDTKENSRMAEQASKLAESIKGNAEKGSQQMEHMIQAVHEINDASLSINKINKVIDDIAFQTNILALNAAVEAARAGQHGKGFAVVAEEVRSLASKSAEAAKDAGSMVANSMEKAALGTSIADETAASLTQIVAGISESSKIVQQIARVSKQQDAAISEIDLAIGQITQVVQQNSATAQESAAASQELSGQTMLLQNLLATFESDNVEAEDDSRLLSDGPSRY